MTQWLFDDLKARYSGIAVVFYLLCSVGAAQAELLPGPLVDVDWLEKNTNFS